MTPRRNALLVSLVALLGAALVALDLLGPAPSRHGDARAAALLVEAYVAEETQVVRDLAERIAAWESLPPAALGDVLRSQARGRPELERLLVAEPSGKVLAGWDATQPLGQEALAQATLDPVLERREALRQGQAEALLPTTEAGHLERLELFAALRSGDGTTRGYVGATLALGPLRERLACLAPPGAPGFVVLHQGGSQLFPCRSVPQGAPRGAAVLAPPFRVTALYAPRPWPWRGVVGLALLGATLALYFGLAALLDRRRRMGEERDRPGSEAAEAP